MQFHSPSGVILWMFPVLICWVQIAETQATLMSGGCGRCCHRRGLMFLRPNQPDYFPGFGPVMGAPQASPMHMKPLLHIYVIPQQHSPHASSSSPFTVLPHRCFKCKIAVNIHACFKGGHLITFSEGSLHTVASVTSHCRPLYREGELLRESNSAVREESCLHCCRRRCGRGARLQKGRTKSPIYTQSQCVDFHYAYRTQNKGIAPVWKVWFALNRLSSYRAFEYKGESIVCNQRSSSAISGLQGRGGERWHNYISRLCALSSVWNARRALSGSLEAYCKHHWHKRALNHHWFRFEADVSQTFSASVLINPTFFFNATCWPLFLVLWNQHFASLDANQRLHGSYAQLTALPCDHCWNP